METQATASEAVGLAGEVISLFEGTAVNLPLRTRIMDNLRPEIRRRRS